MTINSMTSRNRYGALAAEIYDIGKPLGRMPNTEFHLQRLRGETRPILEPACGTGRTLVPLLQVGLDVTGFDRSPDMLEGRRARCASPSAVRVAMPPSAPPALATTSGRGNRLLIARAASHAAR